MGASGPVVGPVYLKDPSSGDQSRLQPSPGPADQVIVKTYLVEKTPHLLELLGAAELRQGLASGRWTERTRIYFEEENRWVCVREHPDWQKAKPAVATPATLQWLREWHYLFGLAPVGPVTYPEMLQLLQRKQLSLQTQVWRPGLTQWTPVAGLMDFHPETIRRIHEQNWQNLLPCFRHRQHQRIPFQAEFVMHNRAQIWPVMSYQLGAGGLGIIAGHLGFELGQEFFLQQTSASQGPSIQSRVQVVSKSTNGMRPGMARYGLEFIDISRRDQQELQQFTDSFRRA